MKKALVLGYGISGKSAVNLLNRLKYKTYIFDENIDEYKNFKLLNEHYDLIILSPTFRKDNKYFHEIVDNNNNTEILSEFEFASRICNADLYAVTGTNGKTTTTTLINSLFSTCGKSFSCGNIGFPLSEIADKLSNNDKAILELSSFQLEQMQNFHPKIATVLNITPDHLDIHKSFENYKGIKNSIYKFQNFNEIAVINADDIHINNTGYGKEIFYSLNKDADCYIDNNAIIYADKKIIDINDIRIKGNFNISNAMAAICYAININVPIFNIQEILRHFETLPHRMQHIETINDIEFINDSKATNPDATIKAIQAFKDNKIAIIIGGSKKNLPIKNLCSNIEKCAFCILYGETSDLFSQQLNNDNFYNYKIVNTMMEAIKEAYKQIKYISDKGIILLSPACASFDTYKNYEERGMDFIECVKNFRNQI